MPTKDIITVALVDDHILLRTGLANLINSFGGYHVIFDAKNGRDFTERLKPDTVPDIVLMDINMPEMDGYETTLWLKKNYPLVNVLALSMYDNENAIIRMFKAGAKGYILKDCDPSELRAALDSIKKRGFTILKWLQGD